MTDHPRRVLIVGATGSFGARLARHLAATSDFHLVLAARRLEAVERLAATLRAAHPARVIEAVALDNATVTGADLARLSLFAAVDTTGPFQGAPPRLAEAAIAAGCHYVDIADARDFVAAFPALDGAARQAGVLAVTGASSTPALSQAALDAMVAGWRGIDTLEVAISPGNRAPRGLSVVQAILARAGQGVRVFRDGAWTEAPGWGLLERRRMPGLGTRWLSLVETPDLDLLVSRFSPRRAAMFRAGLELPLLHLGLSGLKQLVAWRWLRSLEPLSKPVRFFADLLYRFGTDRGGMTVTAEGVDAQGAPVVATFAIIASGGDGPNIPVLPAAAILKALAAGRIAQTGAGPAVGLAPVEAMLAEFAPYRIVVRRLTRPRDIFPAALREAYANVPEAIRAGHAVGDRLVLAGRTSVAGGETFAGRILARLFGFSPAAADVPVMVTMTREGSRERWVREISGHRFQSVLAERSGGRGAITERFGAITFDLRLLAGKDGIDFVVERGRIGPVPLPRALLPVSHARERMDAEGRFTFDVAIALPGIGRLVGYRGWLVTLPANES